MFSLRACLVLPILLMTVINAAAIELRVCKIDGQAGDYRTALMNLLLKRTAAMGERVVMRPYETGDWPTQERCLALLRAGLIDVVQTTPTEARLAEFGVIKTDILNGTLGYRLLLINKKDQALFAEVKTLQDLRRLVGGFSRQWSDIAMFEYNGLPVVNGTDTRNLLPMLNAGRFQYFHRSVNEIWRELDSVPNLTELMVEPHLALAYHMPVYLMFHRDNVALKLRFERGLRMTEADGSFKAVFLDIYGTVLQRAQLNRRTVIEVEAPLPPGLPPRDTSFWLR